MDEVSMYIIWASMMYFIFLQAHGRARKSQEKISQGDGYFRIYLLKPAAGGTLTMQWFDLLLIKSVQEWLISTDV
jgi:hypothetical protein